MVYCVKCGAKNEDNAKWCIKCGESLTQRRSKRWKGEESCFGGDEHFEEECFEGGKAYAGIIVGGIILLIGVILVLSQFYSLVWENFGPYLLAVIGVLIIIGAFSSFRRSR
jgi:uncharacterized membrane protein YvbJ